MNTNQQTNIAAYEAGKLLTNTSRGALLIQCFQHKGTMYVSPNTRRRKEYSLDDGGWETAQLTNWGLLTRLYLHKYKPLIPIIKETPWPQQ